MRTTTALAALAVGGALLTAAPAAPAAAAEATLDRPAAAAATLSTPARKYVYDDGRRYAVPTGVKWQRVTLSDGRVGYRIVGTTVRTSGSTWAVVVQDGTTWAVYGPSAPGFRKY